MDGNVEPWRQCASWLTRCGVLRDDHKANWAEAILVDLAYTLRDGVLLCNLLNVIEPGCIDVKDVNQKPRMAQFLCLRNIKIFLQACHEAFGLRESDLFEPSVLFDLTDFVRVLQTLSKLSTTPKFQRKNISGFSVLKTRTLSQDDMYRNLSSSPLSETSPRDWTRFTSKTEEIDEKEEEIYEGLCYVRLTIPFKTFGMPYSSQGTTGTVPTGEEEEYSSHHVHMRNEEIYQDLCVVSRRSCPPYNHTSHVPSSIPVSLEKRDYVINELVETERNYVDVLTGLQRSFMRPLASVIREEDFKVIFAHLKELSEIHNGFLSHLRKAVAPQSRGRLSEVFLNWREKFLLYGDYIANLTTAQNLIHELCSKFEVINCEVERCQLEVNHGKFKLRDILSVPMQRILKYHLLLDKLVSETQVGHDDYRGLERAKEAMVDVAQYINEVKRDSDTLAILRDIEHSINDWNMPLNVELKDYGRLIIDGELRIKAHNDQKQKVRYVFVFDTVMVMCKAVKGDQYCFKESLKLEEYKIQDVERKILTRDARWSYQWYLVHRAQRTAYTCYCRTDEVKRKWMKAIADALDNMEPSGCRYTDHKFHMHTFDKPTTCTHCSKFLKGKIYQGYKCERCNVTSHKLCIPHCGRCGTNNLPALPPRLPPPAATPITQQRASSPGQANGTNHAELAGHLWFVGEMGRERAACLLDSQPDGTYLLRVRPQGPTNPSETEFALSLKTNEKVKHMKVYARDLEEGVLSYYLSVSRFFKSIIELVTYYQHISLEENFVGLNVKLEWPYRRIVVIAEYDFNPTESNQLPLQTGCEVIVLSKEGDDKGWWKGKIQNREGFFPKQYVREVSDTLTLQLPSE